MTPNNELFGVTPEWIEAVKLWEGFRADGYVCPANYVTQGYGRRVGPPDEDSMSTGERHDFADALPPVTKERATEWLIDDLSRARDAALSLSPTLLNASERRVAAIADFCFNVGRGRYHTSTLRIQVNAGDWKAAALQNARWTRGGGKILPGLVKRRKVTTQWLKEG